jgi:protein-tyrosine phosphatase
MYARVTALFPFWTAHPAVSFAGSHAIHVWRWEGFHLWGRTKHPMATEAFVQNPPFGVKMVFRAMRNVLIGLTVFLVVGNLAIFFAFRLASTSTTHELPPLPGIKNLAEVDSHVWRGSAPSRAGFQALATQGVTTIVDLRAEDLFVDEHYINSLGMEVVRIPMRDGQTPTQGEVDRFLAAARDSEGRVFLHCGAGVGRTGTMSAAYLVQTGQENPMGALKRNMAVGPPSLEQIAFAAGLEQGEATERSGVITALSRVLDAPRRLLVRARDSYGG